MKRIPETRILTQNNYGDSYKDTVESFNLDLSTNYGAIRTTRTKLVTDEDDQEDMNAAPVGFIHYNDTYWAIAGSNVFQGGSAMSDAFTVVTSGGAPDGPLNSAYSDIELFNGSMYISSTDSVFKYNGSSWSEPITTQLTATRPHLLKAYGAGDNERLYVTDEYYKVHSISTADAISATGSFTLDLKLSDEWVITMREAGQTSLWVGLTNPAPGRGLIYEWDGSAENLPDRRIELEAGVIAGTVLTNIPFIVDARGRLLEFNGSGFAERDRFFFKEQYYMDGTTSPRNDRFIHPNGMTTTDYGTILIAMHNEQDNQFGHEDSTPSGVYEYIPNVGLSHRYSISLSEQSSTDATDYGQQRLGRIGAIFFSRSRGSLDDRNGTLLIGAETYSAYTNILTNTQRAGIFIDDTIDTTPKMGYFITKKIYSDNIQDAWDKVYAVYNKFASTTDQIVVKYRLTEKNSTSADCTWSGANTFVTTDDVSAFEKGDEVTVLTGTGAGQTMHITNIESSATTYTVTVDTNQFSSTSGFAARFENFQLMGTMQNNLQYAYSSFVQTTAPYVQLKVELYFTGKQEVHKLEVHSNKNI